VSIHEYKQNLQDARQHAWHEAKELLEVATTENREMSPEEQVKWDKINEDIDAKDAQIRSLIDREEREREAATVREADARIMSPATIERRDQASVNEMFEFLRGERRTLDINLAGARTEKRKLREGMEARDLQEDVAGSGGYLVPTELERRLVDFLEFYTGARQLNVTTLTTASGDTLDIPTVATHGTAALKGEGTALAEADGVFAKVTLGAWKYGVLTQITSELLADSAIDAIGFVAEDTARSIGRITDTDYVLGSGSSKPKGIISSGASVGATAQAVSTGVPGYANLIDLVYSVNPLYRARGAQFFMLDTSGAKIRKILDTTGRPIWEPNVQAGEPDRLLGYPVVYDPNVAAFATAAGTAMAFGDFRGFYIRDVAGMRFERSDDFAFSTDLVTFRTVLRTDSDYVDGNGVKLLKMPTT
jgi:HK97 family phage major capsid protein